MSTETTETRRPPLQVVRRTMLWDGDLVSIPVPARAKVLALKQDGEEFTYLAFRMHIADDDFINVHIRPAGAEAIGTTVKGWLSIWEKQFADGRVYRYIDVEPVDEAEADESVTRWFRIVPNRAEEVEIREGWMFYGIPHPTKRGETLRGAILLYPPHDSVRFLPPARKPEVEATGGDGVTRVRPPRSRNRGERRRRASEAHEREPAVEVAAVVSPEVVEVAAPAEQPAAQAPEPVRMGEVPRPKRERKPRSKAQAKPVEASPAATPEKPAAEPLPQDAREKLAELAANGFGMRSAFPDHHAPAE